MKKLSLTEYALIAGAIGVGYTVYKTSQAVDTVSDVVKTDLNPASNDNIINKGVSKVGSAITGKPDFSLGAWIYDITHPKDESLKNVKPVATPEFEVGDTVNLYEEDIL